MKRPKTILKDYLALRRSLGFDLRKHETALREFVKFFTAARADYLTTGLALQWARKPTNTDPAWWTERLSMLRGLASYWKTVDPRTEIPPLQLLLPQYRRPAPYIYSDQEITRILATTRKLSSEDRMTYWTLFGLLTATGMRVGEALALNDSDVDLNEGVITIRDSKLDKTRVLPLHPTTRQALHRYRLRRCRRFRRATTQSFFGIVNGRRPSHAVAWSIFRRVLIKTALRAPSQKKGPRLHDLRHTFAVKALMGLYRDGKNIDRGIHALSMYLGHTGIRCTYWYLTAVPELMSLALTRLEKRIGGAP
jgi:integrase/recombinase XerD